MSAMVHCPCCKRAWKAAPANRVPLPPLEERALEFAIRATGVTEMELFGQRRQAHLVRARALFVWIVRTYALGESSYSAIARTMGGRDHTTIRHLWLNRVPKLLERDPHFRAMTERFAAEASQSKETRDGDTRH